MRGKIIFGFILLIFSFNVLADTYVNGYYRKNGTYVQPHYRSDPNHTQLDNWSTKGNTNPYTGREGTRTPNDYNTVWPANNYNQEQN